jgi:hypothetical protein
MAIGTVHFAVVVGSGPATIEFTTLAQTGQFTVTSGYSKINVVDVPQRLGITVFAGFDPLVATLGLIFDNFGNTSTTQVEDDINVLEWMTGQGHSVAGQEPKAKTSGILPAVDAERKPPGIEVDGSPAGIIPSAYREIIWIITGLAWEESIRDSQGNRQRQKVTVTLTQAHGDAYYTPIAPLVSVPLSRKWRPYSVPAKGNNTCLKIAKNVLKKSGESAKKEAKAIKDYNSGKHGLSIRTIKSPIKAKAKIQIPG